VRLEKIEDSVANSVPFLYVGNSFTDLVDNTTEVATTDIREFVGHICIGKLFIVDRL
jgi:hypothetical protein